MDIVRFNSVLMTIFLVLGSIFFLLTDIGLIKAL